MSGYIIALSIERFYVRISLMPFRNLGKFVYSKLPKSLGMLLERSEKYVSMSQTKMAFKMS